MLQMNQADDWLRTGWALDLQTHAWLLDSLLCITCSLKNSGFSVLHCHKSYLTLTYVTCWEIHYALELLRRALLARLLPCSLVSLRGFSLAISNQKLVPPLCLCSLVKFYSLIFLFNYGTLLKGLTDQSIIIINFMILVISVPKDVFKC